jgi:HK97 family phage prohead protease
MSLRDTAPRDNLYRGFAGAGIAPELRADDDAGGGTGSLMFGHFAVFDQWTEIHSWYEGDFLETLVAGSFTKTIAENRDQVKVQFDHGYDFHVGDSPLGPIEDLSEDNTGAYYEVPLLDTDYNRGRILPMLQGRTIDGRNLGSVLGASFRFRVIKDEWDEEPGRSDHNPDGLPERTIKEVRLYEFGPVVFPAYDGATAAVRSIGLTDHYLERRRELRSARTTTRPPAELPAGPTTGSDAPDEPARSHSTEPTRAGVPVHVMRKHLSSRRR